MAFRPVGMLVMVASVLAGCGLLPGTVSGPGFQGGGSCSMLPGGACQDQFDRAAARRPGATMVEVACTVPVCDRKGGAGTVVVTLANGGKVTETFTYVGDPAPVPVPACTGMAMDVCRSIATTTVDGLPPSKAIRAISIACAASSCTEDRGEVDVRVQFSDGSEFQGWQGWQAVGP